MRYLLTCKYQQTIYWMYVVSPYTGMKNVKKCLVGSHYHNGVWLRIKSQDFCLSMQQVIFFTVDSCCIW